jgi:Brp/Blh family beta-carotene 15,15'-monooxygenase
LGKLWSKAELFFQPGATAHIDWAFNPTLRLVTGTPFALAVLVSLGLGYAHAHRSNQLARWYIEVWENLLLAAYFSLVPPVLAIGVYFCLWHFTRHIARLMLIEPQAAEALRAKRFQKALARFYRDALPLTVAAAVILAGFYVVVPRAPENIRDFVGLHLTFIAALTFPHMIIVSWMDWQQGVWRAGNNKSPAKNDSAYPDKRKPNVYYA